MSDLFDKIEIAEKAKPAMGEPCNNCGWCCLTEVCRIGRMILGSGVIPCALLIERDGKYFCSVADNDARKRFIGIGTGCDAITVGEQLEKLAAGELPENIIEKMLALVAAAEEL